MTKAIIDLERCPNCLHEIHKREKGKLLYEDLCNHIVCIYCFERHDYTCEIFKTKIEEIRKKAPVRIILCAVCKKPFKNEIGLKDVSEYFGTLYFHSDCYDKTGKKVIKYAKQWLLSSRKSKLNKNS